MGSDASNETTTFVTLLGVEACRSLVREHTEKAKQALREQFPQAEFLLWLADYLADRTT